MANEDKAWLEYQKNFSSNYDDLNYAQGLQAYVMKAGHKLSEKRFTEKQHFSKVLEVGAGTGAHLDFVRHSFDQYILTDHDKGALDIAKEKADQGIIAKLVFETQNGSSLNFKDDTFDRVFAGHVLEHIYQPHLALKEWARVLKDGGMLSILIPTDPGVAWRLGRSMGSRQNAIAQGMAYDYVMAREHVNPCNNLIAFLKHYFPDYTENWWPFPVASIDLNLFYIFNAVIRK
jgi:ubiquinone/menaquinone biosynthesis C-methylase UbiE